MHMINPVFQYCDEIVGSFAEVIKTPVLKKSSVYYTGVDLGTACIVLAVLDENQQPVAGAYRLTGVVKDGMVVDYLGAIRIVKELKQELEEKLDTVLIYAAAALPPGTFNLDGGAIKHVVQGAGFEITGLLDEPTAANAVLKIKDGAIVDIGGGTTGIAVLQDSRVIYAADEPTGGTHFSLVIAGAYKMSFDDADLYKRDPQNQRELLPVLRPVIEKVSSIISRHVKDYQVEAVYLVGGTCCLAGIENIIAQRTGFPVYKPQNPMFVTPLGIALNCTREALR
ncbi:MAG: ethanolamine utilization protein EutJ [Peptococcaceae bacterium]